MKRVARICFVLAMLTVIAPVVLGLFELTSNVPVVLVAPCLIVAVIIVQTRSDPVYARASER